MNLKEIVTHPQATFIDVRESEELEKEGKIEKAIHIALDDIPYQIEEIEQMSKPIVIFCRSGNRSEKAIEVLEQNGIDELYNGGGLTDMQALLE